MSLLIYGANGYTGKLVVQQALAKGLKPTIAGRNGESISKMATEFGLPYLVFSLDNIDEIARHLNPFSVVLHCAGPFSETARPMIEACLISQTHYLDITGEIAILDWTFQKNTEAISKNIMLMCGVGFDLVPTDCVANKLKNLMPDATHLEIAFFMKGGSISHGTMTTMANNLGNTSYERINEKLVPKPLAHKGKTVDFKIDKKFCISIPWGDLYSAYVSTQIPNITTYSAASKSTYYILKLQFILNPVLKSKWFKNIFKKYIDKNITGPTPEQNKNGRSYVYGAAANALGNRIETVLECAESYQITAIAAVHIAQKVLAGNSKSGYQTPASCYGADLILEMEGSQYLK